MENNNIVRIYNNIDIINLKNDSNDDKVYIEGYAAHYGDANLNMERVDADSFNKFFEMYDEKKLKPYLNYEHDRDKQIGGIDELKNEKDGLWIRGHLNLMVPFVKDWVYGNLLSGDLKSFSTEGYAYDVTYLEDGSYYVGQFILTAVAVTAMPADWKSEFSVCNAYNANKAKEAIEKSKWYLL